MSQISLKLVFSNVTLPTDALKPTTFFVMIKTRSALPAIITSFVDLPNSKMF